MGLIKIRTVKNNILNSATGDANQGANPVFDVFAKINAELAPNKERSRALLQFDLTNLQNALNQNLFTLSSSTVSATFYLSNTFSQTAPPESVSYDVNKITRTWDDGNGFDLSTTGYSNWMNASASALWTNPGGDYAVPSITSITASTGYEDIVFDIKNQLIDWTTGTNYGLIIKLSDLYESGTGGLSAESFYKKSFYGRFTSTIFEPYIDIVWNDKFADNSNSLYFGTSGSVYFYNKQGFSYADLDGANNFPGYMSLTGNGNDFTQTGSATSVTSVVLSFVNGTRVSTGIYKFDLPSIPLTAGTLTAFGNVWTITSALSAIANSISKPIVINSPIKNYSLDFDAKFYISVMNFKERIHVGDIFNYSVFIKRFGETLASLTAGTTAQSSFIATNGYWKIVDDRTGVDIYPWQFLSYNDTLNFFSFDSTYLYRNRPYRMVLKFNEGDKLYLFDSPQYYYTFYAY